MRSSEAPHTPGGLLRGVKRISKNPPMSAKNHARKQAGSRLQESNSTPPATQAERNEPSSAVPVNQVESRTSLTAKTPTAFISQESLTCILLRKSVQ